MRRRAAGPTVALLLGAGLSLGPGGGGAVAATLTPTTTTLSVTPTPPQPVGTTLIFTAALTPDTVVGTCTFYDGSTVMLVETSHFKSCALQTDSLAPGPHTLRVTFVPTNSGSFGPSADEIGLFVGSASTAMPVPTSVSASPTPTVTPTVATKAGGGQRPTEAPTITPIDTIGSSGGGRTQVLGRKLALTGAPAVLATGTGLGLVAIGLPLALVGRRTPRANGR